MALEIATILPEFKTTSALKLVFLTPQKDLLNDEGLPTRLDVNATQTRRRFFLSDSASIPTEDCNLKHEVHNTLIVYGKKLQFVEVAH